LLQGRPGAVAAARFGHQKHCVSDQSIIPLARQIINTINTIKSSSEVLTPPLLSDAGWSGLGVVNKRFSARPERPLPFPYLERTKCLQVMPDGFGGTR
ncbi:MULTISPECIES: hypothetical protein, partial [unclassified Pseudomonas]|uniref:hypothetical protein n=1 Tax=unclassified Pseudomonas TaxID=196821 RepID=UPI000D49887A